MLNAVWALLMLVALGVGGVHGTIDSVGSGLFTQAMQAAKLAIDLAAVTAFWFGLSRIAEKSGLLETLARPLMPLLRFLFRKLPEGHPAFPLMAMNLVANALGLGSAATPFGLKAMQELSRAMPDKETASDDMILFLVLNSAALNLLPAGTIAMRAAAGSLDPAGTAVASTIVTGVAFVSALILHGVFRRVARASA
jgi:spore maturation protein A